MAVINSVLGKMKGKLGNLSTRTTNSQNIIYARAQEVKNPRTNSQMKQRVKLANVVINYRVLRQFLESYAFENKDPKRSVYNEFVALNLSSNSVYLTKEAVQAGACVVAPYTISKGTLPMITTFADRTVTSTSILLDDFDLDTATVASFSAGVLKSNPTIKEGDQLSFVQMEQVNGTDGFPHVTVNIYEMIIDTKNTRPVTDFFPAVALSYSHRHLACDTSTFEGAFAYILSRKDNGKVRVSTQSLVLTSANAGLDYSDLKAAIDSYGSNYVPFLDPDVANATDGTSTADGIPTVASATSDGQVLSMDMYAASLGSTVNVNGSNFASSVAYSAKLFVNNQQSATYAVTRLSDKALRIAVDDMREWDNINWKLVLVAGTYEIPIAASDAGMTEG